jgi:pimeloyl-ACP methyl ester carboxylesterase
MHPVKKIVLAAAMLFAAVLGAFAAAIVFGGPGTTVPLKSISDPFKAVDFSDQPPLETFLCRGGDPLAFREYKPASGVPGGTVVLIHGSSGHSSSMHALGKALSGAGYQAFAIDMRGHGGSKDKGRLKSIGHLEKDIEDFAKATGIGGKATLVGFSSGGGFALRLAASEYQDLFASYVLLAPFIGHEAPTYRPGSGWASVGVPRMIALSLLTRARITAFNHLPVIRFAVSEEVQEKQNLTREYSFALAMNFGPPGDYKAAIQSIHQPTTVLVGEKDELFHGDQFAPLFASLGSGIPVKVLPGVDHIGLILDEKAIQAVIAALPRPAPAPIRPASPSPGGMRSL